MQENKNEVLKILDEGLESDIKYLQKHISKGDTIESLARKVKRDQKFIRRRILLILKELGLSEDIKKYYIESVITNWLSWKDNQFFKIEVRMRCPHRCQCNFCLIRSVVHRFLRPWIRQEYRKELIHNHLEELSQNRIRNRPYVHKVICKYITQEMLLPEVSWDDWIKYRDR